MFIDHHPFLGSSACPYALAIQPLPPTVTANTTYLSCQFFGCPGFADPIALLRPNDAELLPHLTANLVDMPLA